MADTKTTDKITYQTEGLEAQIERDIDKATRHIEELEDEIVIARYAQSRLVAAWEALTEQKWEAK